MTFIASVVAKKGVAIIADSLVTTMRPTIELDDFEKYIKSKSEDSSSNEFKVDPAEIAGLFKSKPSHTKDYEDKLFQYDKFTAITTAGSAQINGKKIEALIAEMVKNNHKNNKSYSRKKISTKVNDLALFIENKAKTHIESNGFIKGTTFLITHYDKNAEVTKIFKIEVVGIRKEHINDDTKFVTLDEINKDQKVVCEGQNRISERILYGELLEVLNIISKVVDKIAKHCPEIKDKILTQDYITSLFKDREIIGRAINDMKIHKLTDLSLQQAADLANLLMRIEMDFQKFTENIPVVGGVIKLAVIDKNGFKYISGHEIILHNNY